MAYSPDTLPIQEPIRIAVIGCGWIGAFHARSLAGHLPGVLLEAVADPAPGAAAALATELGIAKHTTDPADLFADPDVDGVLIAAPSAFHSALIAQAAAAGKHVFSEKPAGLDLAELEGALDAVDRAGVEFLARIPDAFRTSRRHHARQFILHPRDRVGCPVDFRRCSRWLWRFLRRHNLRS